MQDIFNQPCARYPSPYLYATICYQTYTLQELEWTIAELEKLHANPPEHFSISQVKDAYNNYLGWAFPSKKVLDLIVQAWKLHVKIYPTARLVDYGSGTGLYSALLSLRGIDPVKIVALDLKTKTHPVTREFWTITYSDEFTFKPDDFVFIGWGYGQDLKPYTDIGGTCIVIQGELEDGCTFPADFFSKSDDWTMVLHGGILSFARTYGEYMSINTRYN